MSYSKKEKAKVNREIDRLIATLGLKVARVPLKLNSIRSKQAVQRCSNRVGILYREVSND